MMYNLKKYISEKNNHQRIELEKILLSLSKGNLYSFMQTKFKSQRDAKN